MFSIRVAKFSDAKKIARIRIDTLHLAPPGEISGAALNARSAKQRETFWRGRFEQARGLVFVIESDDIVGFCDLIPARDKDIDPKSVYEIAAVYAISEYWRMGAGKALCYHVLGDARKRGCQALTLWVLASNSNTMRFFESLGFTRDGTFKVEMASDGSNLQKIRYRVKFNRPDQT
ncbi:MAG TPA: GNAT family N-acetyltransferase [Verrucomicrobiae bacterium]|nr:GNAT family N-acetyltransferase [Verrucomicrobiae bacterium]